MQYFVFGLFRFFYPKSILRKKIIAAIMSIILKMDILNWQKIFAAGLVFTGVILVNKSKAKDDA